MQRRPVCLSVCANVAGVIRCDVVYSSALARNGIGTMQWCEDDKQLPVVTGLRPVPVGNAGEYA